MILVNRIVKNARPSIDLTKESKTAQSEKAEQKDSKKSDSKEK